MHQKNMEYSKVWQLKKLIHLNILWDNKKVCSSMVEASFSGWAFFLHEMS